MKPIKVALVDDYEVVVRGLAAMLRTYHAQIEIVEINANSDVDQRVDVALYDSFANPQGDREQVRQMVANPQIDKVVVYSWNVDPTLIEAVMANGARGYISKGLPAANLVAALTEIHGGTELIHIGRQRGQVVGGDWPGREEGLTQRESEVLALITQGMSNAEIVDFTGLSVNSVKTYIRSCYRRIGVTNRTKAVLWGVDHGFLPDRARRTSPNVS